MLHSAARRACRYYAVSSRTLFSEPHPVTTSFARLMSHANQHKVPLSPVSPLKRHFSSSLVALKDATTIEDASHGPNGAQPRPAKKATNGQSYKKVLTLDTINPKVKEAKYAVRGELALRAEELRKELTQPNHALPFSKIINCNIGNPQQLKQKPITFFRQVLSLLEWPDILQQSQEASRVYPPDVIKRAKEILKACGGSIGAYSHSKGIPYIRNHVAQFLQERDGFAADPEHIFLTNGASEGVKAVLDTLVQHPNCGVLIPIPQYPLYTASLTLFNAKAVPYYLDEGADWTLKASSVQESIQKARAEGIDVRALVVINPGNPIGNCLKQADMEEIVRICHRENIILMADEVYQTNIFEPQERPFVSFKKVLRSMPSPIATDLEMFSFNSASKGCVGECGHRGGYFEAVNIDPTILDQLYKMASINLCPNIQGQALIDLMVHPPRVGDASYTLYKKETEAIHASLARRAQKLYETFQKLTNVTCAPAQGAMYLFPQIRFSNKVHKRAEKAGKNADEVYAMDLLEATGICVVAGSGFGQKPDTFHFRATFLPPEEQFDDFLKRLTIFHEDFMKRNRD